ncbi:hypothetical protein [Vannielia litorea]|uniref:hypothetical protein n=1 Tax=Vannielia litorea TaxID=1217970 RepID=UPI001C93CAB7|nr:hypothetical protein [Vannielia litorea]MBY6048377.1 hypothetical protein [Vannielia litorea]MBY6075791.1 hypothetical protein [Vannielia litorea]
MKTAPTEPPHRWAMLALVTGVLLLAVVALNFIHGLGVEAGTVPMAAALAVIAIALLARGLRGSRLVFLAISLGLTAWCLVMEDAPGEVLWPALERGSFIIAFFCALASLQHVAGRSPMIARAAAFLANQPPGRRYLALASGTQVFALMLNYGALSLLGTMAMRSAERETDPAIRTLRARRMLQGAQCGFSASLCWSPLAFATVITTALVPGVKLGTVVLTGIGSSLIIVTVGWLVDRRLKGSLPAGTVVPKRDEVAAHDTRSLWPLGWLLAAVAVPALAVDAIWHIPPSRTVLGLVPLIAIAWVLIETLRGGKVKELAERSRDFAFGDLPSYRSELVLLSTAGFIGTAAGALLAEVLASSGFDLGGVPERLVLVLPILLIPLAGQLGLNPILFVSLFAQLLPTPEELGVSTISLVMALISGWTLTAPTSPFTASVMIISRLAGVSPQTVAFKWNGWFVSLTALALGIWVQILA